MFSHPDYQRGFDWTEFLSGILFILISVYFFSRPVVALGSLVVITALIAIVRGIVNLSSYTKFRAIMPVSWLLVVAAVLDIIIGLLFLFDTALGSLTIAYLFGFWFLIDAITGLLTSGHLRTFGGGWFAISVIFDILALALGVMMILQPALAAYTLVFIVTWFLLVAGLNHIVIAFARR
ncbi:DUF308 domain-containing protein [Lactobacillus sp. CC-MHH1034]|uniref:HdeD family acid-resistance protein n=1 Tax=Agrilactobacillus fermenti TaxID=2586909 RepID=UPI001E3DC0DE|nr:DUF308 domain-containing protein [Agrilactobacillus fermenti]MCD2256854.1 DUF308 domain-containing protein [Agrilactobacillus fermenti]